MDQSYLSHSTNLSAEVEPFVPRSDVGNMMAEHMIPQTSQGPLPHYLTSCYPFVQDQSAAGNVQGSGQYDYQSFCGRDPRSWSQQAPSGHSNPPFQQHVGPPNRFSAPPQAPAANITHTSAQSTPIYTYHAPPQFQFQGMAQVPYHSQYIGNNSHYPMAKTSHGKRESSGRRSAERKQLANKKGQRSVGIQMEVQKTENSNEDGTHEMVDYSQQTDFPAEIASKTLAEKPSPLRKMTRSGRKWRRANTAADHSGSCDSSDNNGDEADVDSDSGYYSPKHQISRRNHALTQSGAGRDEPQGIGTAIHPNYPPNDLSPQRLLYLSGPPPNHPSAYYQVHPSQYLGAASAPGQIIRLPTPGTPPMIMTPPPPMMNLAPGTVGYHNHATAIANFKSRPVWEQEILKAHNVAPICPPTFVPRQRAPYGPHRNRGGGQHNWHYPRFQNSRQHRGSPGYNSGRINEGTDAAMGHESYQADGSRTDAGLLRLNPNTAPQHLIQQNPPHLTDEDFPDLRPSAGAAGSNAYPLSSFSYSAALQNKPKPAREINVSDDSPIKSIIEADDSGSCKGSRRRRKKTERAAKAAAEEYAEISKEQENIKKQFNKKTAPRSKTPQLDLAEMLSKLKKTQAEDVERSPSKTNTAQPEVVNHNRQRVTQIADTQYLMPHNPLDSSAPLKKRGKEREIPRIKKPSALKKVILKEREEKKYNRLSNLTTEDAPEYDIPPVPTDYFKSEFMQKESSQENNFSDAISTSEPQTPDNRSPVTVSLSGNSSPVVPANIPKIHSRRYREYCSGQVLDKQIDEECIVILQKLVQFQERMYQKDPIKAKSRRRFVLGIREVTKHLKLKKVSCVLISPNLEKIQSKGGLDDALQQIIQLCKAQSVPYAFALGRCAMGRAVSKLVPVSIIGIFDYSGVEENFKNMLDLVQDAQKKYHDMMLMYQQEITEATATPPMAPPAPAKRFAHMGHSRNPSAASCVSFCSMISEPISEMNPAEGTSWRNMMDVTDEQNPAPALSPPPENAQEDDLENETSGEKTKSTDEDSPSKDPEKDVDANQEDYEDTPSDENEDSYLNALDNSGSLTSDEKQNTTESSHLDKSFSTVSTVVVVHPTKDTAVPEKGKPKIPGSENVIPSIMEEALSDPEARINSWLASSVQNLEVEDSPIPDHERLEKIDEKEQDQEEEEEDDDFVSTHEDEIADSQE